VPPNPAEQPIQPFAPPPSLAAQASRSFGPGNLVAPEIPLADADAEPGPWIGVPLNQVVDTPPDTYARNQLMSLQFSTKANPRKVPALVGDSNSSLEILTFISLLSDRYTAKATRCSQDGFAELLKISVADRIDPTIKHPVFELRFNARFSKFKIDWASKGEPRFLPDRFTFFRKGTTQKHYNYRFDFVVQVHDTYESDHPWSIMKDVLMKVHEKDGDGQVPAAINGFVLPELLRAWNHRTTTDQNRGDFLRVLASLTNGSIRFQATKGKVGKHQKRVDKDLRLYSMTVVFPWATDLLSQNPACAMTDSTFKSCKPYTLAILHLIFANESVPIGFAISPSETADSYIRLYDHIHSILGVVARRFPEKQINPAANSAGTDPWDEGAVEKEEGGARDDAPEEEELWDSSGEREAPAEAPNAPAAESPECAEAAWQAAQRVRLRAERTLLTQLPILTDQGSALQKFVAHFQLEWKLCHRHIIENVGAKGRLTDFVCRLLRCFSLEEYQATRESIIEEIQPREDHLSKVPGWDSLLRLLGILVDNHPLSTPSTWALWMRLGCPRTTNSAESVNGRLNADTAGVNSFVERVFIVVRHFLCRYNSRFSWSNRAVSRNRRKIWPADNAPWSSPAKAEFYRKLHMVNVGETYEQRMARQCIGPADPWRYIPMREDACQVRFLKKPRLPDGWAIVSPILPGARHLPIDASRPLLLSIAEQSARTERSHMAWTIAYSLMKHLGPKKWKHSAADIVERIHRRSCELGIPETGISALDQAHWRTWCWDNLGQDLPSGRPVFSR
jgi:hypothetical protein